MNFPVEKHGVRFYNYYFHEVEKPITIEATNKQEAREAMKRIIAQLSDKYRESKIVGETVTIPLKGVSEKTIKGIKYIWVGFDKSKTGWLPEMEFKAALERSKRKY